MYSIFMVVFYNIAHAHAGVKIINNKTYPVLGGAIKLILIAKNNGPTSWKTKLQQKDLNM